jgi:Family of unknown function (DUF6232)
MIIYYRGPTALITERALEVWCPGRQWFAIAGLSDVHVVRGAADPLAVEITRVVGALATVALVALPFLGSANAWFVAGFLVVPRAISCACWHLGHREYQLRATYNGYLVRLYASSDLRTFEQVRRALFRAIEVHR